MFVKLGLKAKKNHVPHSKIWYIPKFPLIFYFENTPQFYSQLDIQVCSCKHSCWFLRSTPLDGFQEVLKRLWFSLFDSSFRTFKNPHVQLWRRLKPFQSCWIWTMIFFVFRYSQSLLSSNSRDLINNFL